MKKRPLEIALDNIRQAARAEQVEPEDWGLLRAVVKESAALLKTLERETAKKTAPSGKSATETGEKLPF